MLPRLKLHYSVPFRESRRSRIGPPLGCSTAPDQCSGNQETMVDPRMVNPYKKARHA